MLSYLWEIFVCFSEALLVIYFLKKKLGSKCSQNKSVFISTIIITSMLSILTLMHISSFQRMASMLGICVVIAFFVFDGRKKGNWYKAVLWPSCYLVIVTVADSITFSVAQAMVDYPLEQLMNFGSARIQFTLIYLLLVAVIIWVLTHLGETEPQFPLMISVILFTLMGIGIFAAESILDIALVLGTNSTTTQYARTLSMLGYCILLMLFALLITFECLGVILRKNRELKQQRQLAQIEEQQYEFMLSTAESLTEWKHDYQGQLRLISALIEEENYSELKQFTSGVDEGLKASANLLFTGNRTLDAVISLRMMDAKRHHIQFETKLYLPERLPLQEVAFSSLIGNILDNAIEACLKVSSAPMEIYFEMKPWKKMLYIFCSNTSDGKYQRGENENLLSTKKTKGHGIGMRRIREIVGEAGGTCQFSPEENRFSVSIMIPLEESEDENCNRRKRSGSLRVSPDAFAGMGQGASNDSRSDSVL